MSTKGDWERPRQTTCEEQELRHEYMLEEITLTEFNEQFAKLKKKGLIKRNGRVVK